jgi:hypothetical protein
LNAVALATGWDKNQLESEWQHTRLGESTVYRFNCRALGKKLFREKQSAIKQFLANHPTLSLLTISSSCCELSLSCPLAIGHQSLQRYNQDLKRTQKSRQRKKTPTYHQETTFTRKIKRRSKYKKKPVESPHQVTAPTKVIEATETRVLTDAAREVVSDHSILQHCSKKITRLLDNDILPAARCKGSGLVRIGKAERHRGHSLDGDIKVKLYYQQIAWRICLKEASRDNHNESTTFHYDITSIYQKNRNNIQRVKTPAHPALSI